MEVKLSLTLDEINGIIGTLSMLPFGQVAGLVNKIREQAIPQVQATEAAQAAQAPAPADSEGGEAA